MAKTTVKTAKITFKLGDKVKLLGERRTGTITLVHRAAGVETHYHVTFGATRINSASDDIVLASALRLVRRGTDEEIKSLRKANRLAAKQVETKESFAISDSDYSADNQDDCI